MNKSTQKFDSEKFAKRLHDRRAELGLSMREVGEKAKIDHTVIYKYEKNKFSQPSFLTVASISSALNVSPKWLCGEVDDPTPDERYENAPQQIGVQLNTKEEEYITTIREIGSILGGEYLDSLIEQAQTLLNVLTAKKEKKI